jgi:hypothetical protein
VLANLSLTLSEPGFRTSACESSKTVATVSSHFKSEMGIALRVLAMAAVVMVFRPTHIALADDGHSSVHMMVTNSDLALTDLILYYKAGGV